MHHTVWPQALQSGPMAVQEQHVFFKLTPGVTPSQLMLLEDGSLVCANLWHAESSTDVSRNTCLAASDSVPFGLQAFSSPGPQADLNLSVLFASRAIFPWVPSSASLALTPIWLLSLSPHPSPQTPTQVLMGQALKETNGSPADERHPYPQLILCLRDSSPPPCHKWVINGKLVSSLPQPLRKYS